MSYMSTMGAVDSSAISALQHAINRYWGNLTGSAIAEDGMVGPQTNGAISAITDGLPAVIGIIDTRTGLLSAAFSAQDYASATSILNDIADGQNWLYDSSGVKSDLSISTGGGRSVPTPAKIMPTKVTPPGGLEASVNSLASQFGLPVWGLVAAGSAAVVAIVMLGKKKRGGASRRR